MHCSYCGNSYVTKAPRCEGCGSPRRARKSDSYRNADELYAEVGHALITGKPDRSRALLEKIIGSPQKDPQQLLIERCAKVALCLGLLYMFPWFIGAAMTMMVPFLIFFFLPYQGLKTLFSWISGETPARR